VLWWCGLQPHVRRLRLSPQSAQPDPTISLLAGTRPTALGQQGTQRQVSLACAVALRAHAATACRQLLCLGPHSPIPASPPATVRQPLERMRGVRGRGGGSGWLRPRRAPPAFAFTLLATAAVLAAAAAAAGPHAGTAAQTARADSFDEEERELAAQEPWRHLSEPGVSVLSRALLARSPNKQTNNKQQQQTNSPNALLARSPTSHGSDAASKHAAMASNADSEEWRIGGAGPACCATGGGRELQCATGRRLAADATAPAAAVSASSLNKSAPMERVWGMPLRRKDWPGTAPAAGAYTDPPRAPFGEEAPAADPKPLE
jgi:hypothetical protein